MKSDNKGFSLIELLIAITISSVILGAIVMSFTTSLRVFKDAKSISDNIETKTPSIELISRYFDRWGAGVVSRNDRSDCTATSGGANVCPAQRKSLTITTGTPCSDVRFWGNIHGYGFVESLSSDLTTANLISCRLSKAANQDCYVIWSNNTPMNPVLIGHVDPVSLANNITNQNADCSNLTSSSYVNSSMSATLNTKTASSPRQLQNGDVLHRSHHQIRFFCQQNSLDSNRLWLYVGLIDMSNGSCNDGNEGPYPLAPVNAFTATAIPESPLPSGTSCDTTTGGDGCGAVQVTVTFRSPSQRYGGQFDTLTITRVFGR